MIKEHTKEELLLAAKQLLTSRNDESMSMIILEMMIRFGHAEKMLSVPKITNYKKEMNLGGGRADFVLFHKDGGISIVEVKSDGDIRSIISGIGQLFLYESMMPSLFGRKIDKPNYIRKILASAIDFEKCEKISKACDLAGVNLVNMPTHKQLQSILKRYRDGA